MAMGTAPPHDGLRVLRTARVTPSASGGRALPERALPLTFLDAMWLTASPVDRVFFYRLDSDAAGIVSKLSESLSRTLSVFYPLAGHVRLTPGKTNRYELFYQPGDGVAFTIAEHDGVGVCADELATYGPREAAQFAELVPKLPEGGAVLALQATVFLPARRFLALGVTVSHSACDGASSTHFLHAWAAACAGAAAPPEPPVIDRTLVRDRADLNDRFSTRPKDKRNRIVESNAGAGGAGKLLGTFTLSKECLQRVKDAVAGEAARRGLQPPPRCTSIVATFAVMWQCHNRSMQDSQAELVYLFFLADHRARLEPRLPDSYFGNCVGPYSAVAPRKEITAAGVDGLFTACAAVAAGVATAVDEAGRYDAGYWHRREQRMSDALKAGEPLLAVAGSPRFRVYDVDFGFGKPAKVEMVSVVDTGAMAVADGRDGGIEVGIALPPERMERFQRCFADAIMSLGGN